MKDTTEHWWHDGKFGLFIHWGLYALLAGEYNGLVTDNIAEWILHDLDIPVEEYRRLAQQFNPKQFDADEIVRMARDAGMTYVVFTTKHHEGFSMYHSAVSKYNCVDSSPFKRDPLRELRCACDKYGLTLCIYYSQAQDWDDPNACREGQDGTGKNFTTYLETKCIPQVTELLTNYGKIGMVWFDTPMYMSKAQSDRLKDLVKRLQPDCLINGRIGNGLGDYMTTGDNFIPALPFGAPFEVPATINATWGYSKHDHAWKSSSHILRSLVKVVSRGGNYLLNIGPTADGEVPKESLEVFGDIINFMQKNAESIKGTQPVPVYPYDIEWAFFTSKPGKLFIHIFNQRETAYLLNIANKPTACYRLSDKRELKLKERTTCEGDSSWLIHLLPPEPDTLVQVVCVEFEKADVEFEPIHW